MRRGMRRVSSTDSANHFVKIACRDVYGDRLDTQRFYIGVSFTLSWSNSPNDVLGKKLVNQWRNEWSYVKGPGQIKKRVESNNYLFIR